jgi:hypothetical protein
VERRLLRSALGGFLAEDIVLLRQKATAEHNYTPLDYRLASVRWFQSEDEAIPTIPLPTFPLRSHFSVITIVITSGAPRWSN